MCYHVSGIMYNLRLTIAAWQIELPAGVQLNKMTKCNTQHLENSFIAPLRLNVTSIAVDYYYHLSSMPACTLVVVGGFFAPRLCYILPDSRLTRYLLFPAPLFSPITRGQSEKSITVNV